MMEKNPDCLIIIDLGQPFHSGQTKSQNTESMSMRFCFVQSCYTLRGVAQITSQSLA